MQLLQSARFAAALTGPVFYSILCIAVHVIYVCPVFYSMIWPVCVLCFTAWYDLCVCPVFYSITWPVCVLCFTAWYDLCVCPVFYSITWPVCVSCVLQHDMTCVCPVFYSITWPVCVLCFTAWYDLCVCVCRCVYVRGRRWAISWCSTCWRCVHVHQKLYNS